MDARSGREATPTQERTTMDRTSERELVVTRTIDGPAHIVFEAWTDPELVKRWWVPKSVPVTLLSVEMDVRAGGTYRFTFQVDPTTTMAFFGRYLEVNPPSRLVWTNEEGEGDAVISTLTLDEDRGRTRLVVHDLYPSKDALDAAIASGSTAGWDEMLDQLDELLLALDAGSGAA
ncbi:MAG TPA: SRPBCC domain-containing protein [Candidatus Limnocylindrales bacterium]|nr:SRPBCC domain-containing protein [Candidatus Limnocylindrales bacterium]